MAKNKFTLALVITGAGGLIAVTFFFFLPSFIVSYF